jgi:hypothetical protein
MGGSWKRSGQIVETGDLRGVPRGSIVPRRSLIPATSPALHPTTGASNQDRLSEMSGLELHGFYALTKKLNEKDALLHRQLVTADHPTLPHRAGKLQLRIRQALVADGPSSNPQRPTARRGQRGRIRVHSLARSDIEVDKLAELSSVSPFGGKPSDEQRIGRPHDRD